jgi:2-aminophenol/2-amino-5-chlorophenol 1,6-dioxygenase alpha subunit
MSVVAAFLVPGSPLPFLNRDNPPYRPLVSAFARAARGLAAARPDVVLLYSTQWMAVLDELWQTRPRLTGTHVDENWHEFGELPFDIRIDVELAQACVEGSHSIGVTAKPVDYDQFPIDTGTIVASTLLDPEGRYPFVIAANNLYHDGATTRRLAEMAAECANAQRKKIAVVGVGGLSGTLFREQVDLADDRIARPEDDAWNKKILQLMEKGETSALADVAGDYAKEARVDMGFKHYDWIVGGIGGRYFGAQVHGYGPCYGSGAAVVEFRL